jgi:hypothetical protein
VRDKLLEGVIGGELYIEQQLILEVKVERVFTLFAV